MSIEVGRITITYEMSEDDMTTTVNVVGDIPVATQLDLLRMAEDTILHPEQDT